MSMSMSLSLSFSLSIAMSLSSLLFLFIQVCFQIISNKFLINLLIFMKFDDLSKVKYFQLLINYVVIKIEFIL